MSTASPNNQAWITAAFVELLAAEHSMAVGARAKAQAPPERSLGIVYHEIADADERHAGVIETIATRYGHTPGQASGGGIGAAIGRLKDRVVGISSDPIEHLIDDLIAKAESIHRYTAWVHTLEAIGDAQSSHELTTVLLEENTHRDALQQGLNRLVERNARGHANDSSVAD